MKYFTIKQMQSKYGFSYSYWRRIAATIGHSKSSQSKFARTLINEQDYIDYIDSLKVQGSSKTA